MSEAADASIPRLRTTLGLHGSNEPVSIGRFHGVLALDRQGSIVRVPSLVAIEYAWPPWGTHFSLAPDNPNDVPEGLFDDDVETSWSGALELHEQDFHELCSFLGRARVGVFDDEPVVLTNANPEMEMHSVLFHVVNLPFFPGRMHPDRGIWGRQVVETAGWTVVLDPVSASEKFWRAIELDGGYRITHIGLLRRQDESRFEFEAALEWLKGVRSFLSFARGARVDLVLPRGLAKNGSSVVELWSASTCADAWRKRGELNAWALAELTTDPLEEVLPGFLSELERDPSEILLALELYLQAQLATSTESAILAAFNGLELCAHRILEDPPEHAKPLLGDLLRTLDVPRDKLVLVSGLDNHVAIVEARNALVHSERRRSSERGRIWQQIVREESLERLSRATLWYLDLAMLMMCGHCGAYRNRLTGRPDLVPWAE